MKNANAWAYPPGCPAISIRARLRGRNGPDGPCNRIPPKPIADQQPAHSQPAPLRGTRKCLAGRGVKFCRFWTDLSGIPHESRGKLQNRTDVANCHKRMEGDHCLTKYSLWMRLVVLLLAIVLCAAEARAHDPHHASGQELLISCSPLLDGNQISPSMYVPYHRSGTFARTLESKS
jgi:hypothetical protein